MNNIQKIGSWILGGVAALSLLSRQKVSFGVKDVMLNGMITSDIIPLRVVIWIANNTIIGRIFIRSISGALICNGQTVATINQMINKRIPANKYIEQNIFIDLHNKESLQALFQNVQTGDVSNLAFEFIGEVVIGEQWPVGFKFNKIFTWDEIKQML